MWVNMVRDYLLLPIIMTVTVTHTAPCHTAQFKYITSQVTTTNCLNTDTQQMASLRDTDAP